MWCPVNHDHDWNVRRDRSKLMKYTSGPLCSFNTIHQVHLQITDAFTHYTCLYMVNAKLHL